MLAADLRADCRSLKVKGERVDWNLVPQWIGPVLAAGLTALFGLAVAKGGTEERLLRRAWRSLDLADRSQPRATRVLLRESAAEDVAKALELRRAGRGLGYLVWSALGATTVLVVIPWYAQLDLVTWSKWQVTFWAVMWAVYLVMDVALVIAAVRKMALRARVANSS